MTIKSVVELECPKCSIRTNIQVWNSLNAQTDPEDKRLLLDRKVNLFECTACGYKAWINTKLLFHEMNQNYIVYLFNPEQISSSEFLDSFSKDGNYNVDPVYDSPDIPKYFKNPRYVFSMYELITYVEFRDKLFEYKK
jgi:Zn ribbon nucleic-acid-binding protein